MQIEDRNEEEMSQEVEMNDDGETQTKGGKMEEMGVEEVDLSKMGTLKQLYKVGAYPLMLCLLLDWTAKSSALLALPLVILGIFNGDTSKSSYVSGFLQAITFTLQLIVSPLLGNFSDRYGRKPFILAVISSMTCAYITYAVTTSGLFAVQLPGLFVGVVFFGLASPITLLCTAWIIDKSVLTNKTQNIGVLGASVSGGFLLGAALSVIIGTKTSGKPQTVFYVDIGLLVTELLIAIFVLKESKLPDSRQHLIPWYQNNPFSTICWMFNVEFLPPFIFMIFSANLAHDILVSNFVLWANYRFGWTSANVGITLLIYGAVTTVTQMFLVRIVVPFFGEKIMLITGLAIGGLVYLGFGLTPDGAPWLIYVLGGALGLHTVVHPVVVGLLSRQVDKDDQGRLLGGLDIIKLFGALIGALGSTALFGYLVSPDRVTPQPNIIFFVAAILMLIAIVIVMFVFSRDTSVMMMDQSERLRSSRDTLAEPFL